MYLRTGYIVPINNIVNYGYLNTYLLNYNYILRNTVRPLSCISRYKKHRNDNKVVSVKET